MSMPTYKGWIRLIESLNFALYARLVVNHN